MDKSLFFNAVQGVMKGAFLVFSQTKIGYMVNTESDHILAFAAWHSAAVLPLIGVRVITHKLAKHFSSCMFSGKIAAAEEIDIVARGTAGA